MACWAVVGGLGLLFYILLGSRFSQAGTCLQIAKTGMLRELSSTTCHTHTVLSIVEAATSKLQHCLLCALKSTNNTAVSISW